MKGITPYQLEVMLKLDTLAAAAGRLADFDQLLERLSWKPTKESAQFVVRALVTKGFIEKMPRELRRGRTRVCYKTTEKGRLALDPTREAKAVESLSSGASFEDFDSFIPGFSDEEIEKLGA